MVELPITPTAAVAQQAASTRDEFAVRVLRKSLDLVASQGAALAQMVDQQAGVGRNIDVMA